MLFGLVGSLDSLDLFLDICQWLVPCGAVHLAWTFLVCFRRGQAKVQYVIVGLAALAVLCCLRLGLCALGG